MNKVPLTARGADNLKVELRQLKGEARPRVIKAIAEAREHGDLKENAEYHAARDEQGFIEGRIKDIQGKLSNAQIIDITEMENTGKIIFGTTVKLLNIATNDEVTYQIVGEDEADIKAGMISVTSPVARALIGKAADDVAMVQAPGGNIEYEILEVLYI
ncbi:MAG: transcription elongation factor GreA [Gammaproteobacteria bacterium]|nr:MAG: transcription elongation factor GreA [Gammaproteobacteria bacterium]